MFLTSVSTSHHCHWSFFPTFLVLFVQILQFLTRRQWVGPHSTMKNIQKINKFPRVVSIFLVSLVKRSESRHELKQFPAKKTGFWLANLSGLPIFGGKLLELMSWLGSQKKLTLGDFLWEILWKIFFICCCLSRLSICKKINKPCNVAYRLGHSS